MRTRTHIACVFCCEMTICVHSPQIVCTVPKRLLAGIALARLDPRRAPWGQAGLEQALVVDDRGDAVAARAVVTDSPAGLALEHFPASGVVAIHAQAEAAPPKPDRAALPSTSLDRVAGASTAGAEAPVEALVQAGVVQAWARAKRPVVLQNTLF